MCRPVEVESMVIPHHHQHQSVNTDQPKPTEPKDDSHRIVSFPPVDSLSPTMAPSPPIQTNTTVTTLPIITTTTITNALDMPHLAMSLCKQPLRNPVHLNRVGHLINRRAELVCKSRKTIPLPCTNAALVSRTRHERAKPLAEWTSPLATNSAAAATARFHHLRFKRIPSRLGFVVVPSSKEKSKADDDCAAAQESTLLLVDTPPALHPSPKRPTTPASPSTLLTSRSGSPLLRPALKLHSTHSFRDLRVGSLKERAEALKAEKKAEKEKKALEREERDARQRKIDREREKQERRRKFAEKRAASLLASAIANDDDDDAASLSCPTPLIIPAPSSTASSSSSSPPSSDSSSSESNSSVTTSPTDVPDDLDLDWKSLKKEKLKKKKSRDDSIEEKPRTRKKSLPAPPPADAPPPVPPKDKKDAKPSSVVGVTASAPTSPPRSAPAAISSPTKVSQPRSKPAPPSAPVPASRWGDAQKLCPFPTFTSSYAYDGPPPSRRSPISSSGSRK